MKPVTQTTKHSLKRHYWIHFHEDGEPITIHLTKKDALDYGDNVRKVKIVEVKCKKKQ